MVGYFLEVNETNRERTISCLNSPWNLIDSIIQGYRWQKAKYFEVMPKKIQDSNMRNNVSQLSIEKQ